MQRKRARDAPGSTRLVIEELFDKRDIVDDYEGRFLYLTREDAVKVAKRRLRRWNPTGTFWVYRVDEDIDMRDGEVHWRIRTIEEEVVLTDDDFVAMMEEALCG